MSDATRYSKRQRKEIKYYVSDEEREESDYSVDVTDGENDAPKNKVGLNHASIEYSSLISCRSASCQSPRSRKSLSQGSKSSHSCRCPRN